MNKQILKKFDIVVGLSLVTIILPYILLFFDRKLVTYQTYHLIISISFILVIFILSLFIKDQKNKVLQILKSIAFIYPLFLLASYPFTFLSLLIAITLLCTGLLIPFISLRITWFIYTLGGLVPLPKEHVWFQNKLNLPKKKGAVIKDVAVFGFLFGQFLFLISRYLNLDDNKVLLLVQLMFSMCLFGYSLAVGLAFEKNSNQNK